MDGTRLVAIVEPVAGTASTDSPARSSDDSRTLDRVLASRLDRLGAAMRWGVGSGDDDASAAAHASLALRDARERATAFGFATGDPWRDALLADLGLVLAALLDDLTPRQAQIAGLVLLGGARQAAVAASLGVSRATVSVAVARGRLPAIAGARRAIEALLAGRPGAMPGGGAGDVSGPPPR